MPDIDRYDHGEFCWLELATTDPDAALADPQGASFGILEPEQT